MRKKQYKGWNWTMMRIRDLEKLMLIPDIDKQLDFKDLMKLWEEKARLENLLINTCYLSKAVH